MTQHDKVHKGWNHDRTCVIEGKTSGRTPGHKRNSDEAWVKCVLVPGDAKDLRHKGSPYHILDKHTWTDGMVVACGFVCVVLFLPEQ